ncbi:hypothetical protein ABMA28_006985, partial [Loxostege sticticalis]
EEIESPLADNTDIDSILISVERQTNNVTLSPLLPTPSSSNSAQQQPVPSTSQEEPAVLVEEDGLQPLE